MAGEVDLTLRGPKGYEVARAAIEMMERAKVWPTALHFELWLHLVADPTGPLALELQRRSDAAGWGLLSDAAHPGYARTELIANGPGLGSMMSRVGGVLIAPWGSQSAADGALPQLFAATAPDARPGGYYGPSRLFELVGPPAPARISQAAQDQDVAARLWGVSETLTKVAFASA